MFGTKETITSIQFNQDSTCFIAGRVDGFSIYHTDPYRELYRRMFADGFGVKVAAMLYRTSLIAFTGDRSENLRRYVAQCQEYQRQNARADVPRARFAHLYSPAHIPFDGCEQQFQPNIVYIYDDAVGKILGRLRYRSEVFAIRMRKDCVCVATANQIYIHSLSDLTLLDVVNTADYAPPFQVSTTDDDFLVAYVCPGQPGRVGLNFYLFSDADGTENQVVRRYIDAHRSNITALQLSQDGQYLATGSEAGRTVRVFSPTTQQPVASWRRGADQAVITGIHFSQHNDYSVVCSTKGTVHVFSVPALAHRQLRQVLESPPADAAPPRETRDFTRFRVSDKNLQVCAAFSQNIGTYVVLTENNEYWKVVMGEQGAESKLKSKWLLV